MVSLVRTSFVGLIKARFPGRAGILQTAHPACPDASHPVYTVPMHTLPASTTSNDAPTDTGNKTLINLSEIRLPSARSDFENPTVVVSPPWSRGSPDNAITCFACTGGGGGLQPSQLHHDDFSWSTKLPQGFAAALSYWKLLGSPHAPLVFQS